MGVFSFVGRALNNITLDFTRLNLITNQRSLSHLQKIFKQSNLRDKIIKKIFAFSAILKYIIALYTIDTIYQNFA